MIDKIKDEELKIKQEDLLKNMKMLRHIVADMLGSKSFLKGLIPEPHNGVITVNGEQFPIYISANTIAADVHPDITDDIFDAENYLSLLTDDDLIWYALVEHLNTKLENLQKENKELMDEKNQLKEELTAADNEIEGLEQSLREANQACTEYVHRIDELENENESLKKKLFGGVPTKFGEQERGTPEDKVVRMDLEAALMQQQIAQLNTRIAQQEDEDDLKKRITEYAQKNDELLEHNKRLNQEISKLRVQFNSYSGATVVDNEDMQQKITKEAMSELTARIKELESINENLQKDNEDFERVAAAHLETTAKFAEYKDRQKRLYKHFKNLAEMIEDLMELG